MRDIQGGGGGGGLQGRSKKEKLRRVILKEII